MRFVTVWGKLTAEAFIGFLKRQLKNQVKTRLSLEPTQKPPDLQDGAEITG
jgi:hypothetical protein